MSGFLKYADSVVIAAIEKEFPYSVTLESSGEWPRTLAMVGAVREELYFPNKPRYYVLLGKSNNIICVVWVSHYRVFWFKHSEDAMMFKLRFQ